MISLLCLAITFRSFDPITPNKINQVASQRYRWKNVSIVAGGFVSGILFHPKQKGLAYCRTDIGGAYRWDASANRWIPLLDFLGKPDWNLYGIESIGLDPSDPAKLYLACGTYTNQWGGNGAILRSRDQGRSFLRTDLPFKLGGNEDGRSIGERLAVDPNFGKILYFGTRNNGLWESCDGAASWNQVRSFPVKGRTNGIGTGIVVFDPRSGQLGEPSKTIYVGVASKDTTLYVTRDGGSRWAAVEGQPKGLIPHHMVLSQDGFLYITYSNGPGPNGISGGSFMKLDTNSGVWTDITPVATNLANLSSFGYAGLAIDPSHPKTLVVSTLDRWNPGDDVFRTSDGGKSWWPMRAKSTRDDSVAPYMKWGKSESTFGWWTGALAMDPFDNSHVMYGTGANIWTSDDTANADRAEPTHWKIGGFGIEETADIDLLSPAVGPHLITAVGDIGGFTHKNLDVSPPNGMTTNPMFGNTDSLDDAGQAHNVIVRVGRADAKQARGGYSTDAGVSWHPFESEPLQSRGSGSVAITANGSTILWAPMGQAPSFTQDFGKTWTPCTGIPAGIQLASDRVDSSAIYAISNSGAVYTSADQGATFTPKGTISEAQRHGMMRIAPGHLGHLWIPTPHGVFRSVDQGNSFYKVEGVSGADEIGFGKAARGASYPTVFLNGEINGIYGVFCSDDGGRKWVKITDPQHEYATRGIVIGDPRIFGRVYLGTNGRGVLYGDPK